MKEKRTKERKKTIPFRDNLLENIRLFPGPIQFFMLRAVNPTGSPLEQGRTTIGVTSERIEQVCLIWILPRDVISPEIKRRRA